MRLAPLAALALLFAAPVAAQDAAGEPSIYDGDYLAIGAGVGYGPSYEGSDDYVAYPIPLLQAHWHGIQVNPRTAGLEFDLVPDKPGKTGLNLGISARLRNGRVSQISDPVVESLGKLDLAIEAGPTLGVTVPHVFNPYDSLSLTADVRWDLAGAHGGMVVDPIVNYFTPLSEGVAASLSLNADFGDDAFTRYYYSVTPAGAAASGLPAFDATGGLYKIGARLLLGFDLDGDLRNGGFALVGAVGYARMFGSARRSPVTSIRGSADQWFGALGVGYAF